MGDDNHDSHGALAKDQDGLPLFRGQTGQFFRGLTLAETLELEHNALVRDDLQRLGLSQ